MTTRTDAVMASLTRAHLTEDALAEDMAEALRPFTVAELRAQIVDALLDVASTHPMFEKVGTHWEDCWKAHPECAIRKAVEVVKANTVI